MPRQYEDEILRGTGRSTDQINAAPRDAVFVVPEGARSYHAHLMHTLERSDLQVETISSVRRLLRGGGTRNFVVDHAVYEKTIDDFRTMDLINAYRERNKPCKIPR